MELLQHITEVVKESPTIIVYLVAGLLLLFAGLYVFKGVQFAICAVIGGLIGLAIVDVAGRNDLYYLAAIPALIFGIIGVLKYKVALYIAGSLCTLWRWHYGFSNGHMRWYARVWQRSRIRTRCCGYGWSR